MIFTAPDGTPSESIAMAFVFLLGSLSFFRSLFMLVKFLGEIFCQFVEPSRKIRPSTPPFCQDCAFFSCPRQQASNDLLVFKFFFPSLESKEKVLEGRSSRAKAQGVDVLTVLQRGSLGKS